MKLSVLCMDSLLLFVSWEFFLYLRASVKVGAVPTMTQCLPCKHLLLHDTVFPTPHSICFCLLLVSTLKSQ